MTFDWRRAIGYWWGGMVATFCLVVLEFSTLGVVIGLTAGAIWAGLDKKKND